MNQVYCSALSCGYSGVDNEHWAPLATLILEASYEATLLAALCSHIRTIRKKSQDDPFPLPQTQTQTQTQKMSSAAEENNININIDTNIKYPHKVFLTFLGGGVFRNEAPWIAHAIGRALAVVAHQCAASSSSSSSISSSSNSSEPEPEPTVQLQVVICHFRQLNTDMCDMIDQAYVQELGKLQGRPAAV